MAQRLPILPRPARVVDAQHRVVQNRRRRTRQPRVVRERQQPARGCGSATAVSPAGGTHIYFQLTIRAWQPYSSTHGGLTGGLTHLDTCDKRTGGLTFGGRGMASCAGRSRARGKGARRARSAPPDDSAARPSCSCPRSRAASAVYRSTSRSGATRLRHVDGVIRNARARQERKFT